MQRFCLLFGLMMLGNGLQAQIEKFSLGVQVAPNTLMSEYKESASDISRFSYPSKVGLGLGLILRYDFNDYLSISSGINRVTKRYSFHYEIGPGAGGEITTSGLTFEIPVSISYKLILTEGGSGIKAHAGTSFDIVKQYNSDTIQIESLYQVVSFPRSKSLSAYGGIGFEATMKNGHRLFLGASYHYGLKNIYRSHTLYTDSTGNLVYDRDLFYKGHYLSYDLTYFFYLKKK